MSENAEGQPMNETSAAAASPANASAGATDRLQAVLDVDLPLVARFGGTVVPLKTLAALGSGSMVDMNRAPEDPVELLVGDRVIARGEVVVVSGHYGVRITELMEA
jgi:flagellar motor switch protein FliN/FliY